jgi:PAS domain S-box-containing protein
MVSKIIKTIRPKKEEDKGILEKVMHSISIAEAMNECLWLGDKNHKTIYINPVYEKTSGYKLEEVIGKPADFCFDEETRRIIQQHHGLRSKGAASQYEGTMISKSGKKIPLLISGAPTETGGSIGIFINLTKLKKLEDQKKITEQIIKNSAEAMVVLDKRLNITMWNNGASKIFGYKESEVINKKLGKIIIPKELKEENKKLVEDIETKGFIKNFETKRETKDGVKIDVSMSMSKVINEDKKLIGYLVIYQDITQRKKVNTELQKRFEAIQDAYKELGIQKRQNDYIYEIIDIAVEDESLEKLCKLIVSATCMLTKCDAAVLRLFEKKRKILRLKSCLGVSHKWLDKSKINFENSLAEDAYKTGRSIIIQDLESSYKHRGIKLVKSHGFKTLILIPLIINKELLGTLSMYATDPSKFRLIEKEFLEKFGKQCSLAMHVKTHKK